MAYYSPAKQLPMDTSSTATAVGRRHTNEVRRSQYLPYQDSKYFTAPQEEPLYHDANYAIERRPSRRRRRWSRSDDSDSEDDRDHRRSVARRGRSRSQYRRHPRSRSRSTSHSRSRSLVRPPHARPERPSEAYTILKACKSAAVAGGVEFLRCRVEPGDWSGQKGQRVAIAAATGAAIGSLRNGKLKASGKLPLAEAAMTGCYSVDFVKRVLRQTEFGKQAEEERRREYDEEEYWDRKERRRERRGGSRHRSRSRGKY